jgi:DNA polymerase-3 subunit gamma/tau
MSTDQIRDYPSDLRPDTWDEICGQQLIVKGLKRFCVTGKPPKAIMFTGPYGSGKSTLARLTAMSMACSGRKDDNPDPCGKCESCQMFAGGFGSWNSSVLPPQVPTSVFNSMISSARNFNTASLYSNISRPAPIYMDDLDEHPKAHQQYLKRALDSDLHSFIVSATTKPDAVEKGLLHRFLVIWLQPPEMSDLVPWIKAIAEKVDIGCVQNDAAKTIARCAGMNYRNVLKLIQSVKFLGAEFTVAEIEKAALIVGMSG